MSVYLVFDQIRLKHFWVPFEQFFINVKGEKLKKPSGHTGHLEVNQVPTSLQEQGSNRAKHVMLKAENTNLRGPITEHG